MNKQLFKIQVFHSYFGDGVFQNCKVIADDGTKKIIDRYRLLIRMNDGVFCLYAACQESTVEFIKYLNDQLRGEPLKFLLAANEEQFVSITDLPLNWLGQVDISSKHVVLEQTETDTKLQLKPELSNRIVNQKNVIGFISIYLEDLLARNCKEIRYVIEFKARSMHWVYYVINRSQTKLNDPMICNKDRYFFDGPEPVVLSNGEKALSFNSGETLFPLEQVPSNFFDLVDRMSIPMHTESQPIEHCLIQGLPTPSEGQFGVRQNEANKYVFSEMYIYL